MSHLKNGAWIALLLVCGLLTACASQTGCGTPVEEEPVVVDERPEPSEPAPVPEPEVEEIPDFMDLPDGTTVAVDADGSVIRSVVNFEFDESEIGSGDFRVLQQHATRLNRNRDQSVVIEGHCDERGTREYNLALGERRAMAVQDFLLANGVRPSQMSARSFGEERPVDTGSDEAAWAKNRRVELKYE
ncbi:MAG: peptidoglycan-associated lipoprotein Pal [Gammaproteobacteria bacterium]|nr:peptidoglycan-associated lipoprotein Pal [Gammaproteobacteria bacterium]